MSDEQIIEPVVENQVQETNQVVNNETTPETSSNSSKAVTSLDEAKRVLEESRKSKTSAPATKTKAPVSNTVDYAKQYQEIQKLVGRQSTELGQLRKFYQENQPAIEAYKKLVAQQEDAELRKKMQEDPISAVQELARKVAESQVAPYQELIVQSQASQINGSLKEHLGADYETYAPVMADVLEEFQEMDAAQGSNYAQQLAQNPNILLQMAAGRLALSNRTQAQQQQSKAAQQKAQNLQQAAGVGKTKNVTAAPVSNINELSLDEMRAKMKELGIIK